jgi:hypothetical protein
MFTSIIYYNDHYNHYATFSRIKPYYLERPLNCSSEMSWLAVWRMDKQVISVTCLYGGPRLKPTPCFNLIYGAYYQILQSNLCSVIF